jgi:hypothetical protein
MSDNGECRLLNRLISAGKAGLLWFVVFLSCAAWSQATKPQRMVMAQATSLVQTAPVPQQLMIEATFVELTDADLLAVLAQRKEATADQTTGFSRPITEAQFGVLMKALRERDNVNIVAAPRITTLSGREVQIRIEPDIPGPGFISRPSPADSLKGRYSVDVVPFVRADVTTIDLTVIPRIKEFIGYDLDGPNPVDAVGGLPPRGRVEMLTALPSSPTGLTEATRPVDVGLSTVPPPARTPAPIYRTREAPARMAVWDGQTALVAVLAATHTAARNAPAARAKNKSTLVFVTLHLINSTGELLHKPGELPFAESGVPPQKQ